MKETIYCKFKDYGWIAFCHIGSTRLDTTRRHGGQRQAADEILEQAKKMPGISNVSMKRLTPKQYELQFTEGK